MMTKEEIIEMAKLSLWGGNVVEGWTFSSYEQLERFAKLVAEKVIKEALAQEQDNAYIYASNLAKTIWQKHYIKESPKFALFDTIEGVLTQIDNMTCGLVREKPAQPEQEPVAYDKTEMNCFVQDLYDKKMQEGKHGHYETMFHVVHQAIKKAPPQRTWVGLSEQEHTELAIECGCLSSDWVFYGAALERKIKEKNEI